MPKWLTLAELMQEDSQQLKTKQLFLGPEQVVRHQDSDTADDKSGPFGPSTAQWGIKRFPSTEAKPMACQGSTKRLPNPRWLY